MDALMRVRGATPPPPRGANNLQSILYHPGVVLLRIGRRGERLRGGDANALVEDLNLCGSPRSS